MNVPRRWKRRPNPEMLVLRHVYTKAIAPSNNLR